MEMREYNTEEDEVTIKFYGAAFSLVMSCEDEEEEEEDI